MPCEEFAQVFSAGGFELRFDVAGRAAVRVAGGPVAARHVEPVPPRAAWVDEARCGSAVGWLLAPDPPLAPDRAHALLERTVAHRAALALQARAGQAAAISSDLLERLTHRLQSDVVALHGVAEGLIEGLFEPDELAELPQELRRAGGQSLRRVSEARLVMGVLEPQAAALAEPVVDTLRAELEAAGRACAVQAPADETALALLPGPGWAACARVLAGDPRLTEFAVEPDPSGWRIIAGPGGPAGAALPVTEDGLGALVLAGRLVAAAGGTASARAGGVAPTLTLTLPAAPPPG